jgi:hypothetical protein
MKTIIHFIILIIAIVISLPFSNQGYLIQAFVFLCSGTLLTYLCYKI